MIVCWEGSTSVWSEVPAVGSTHDFFSQHHTYSRYSTGMHGSDPNGQILQSPECLILVDLNVMSYTDI